MVLTKHSKNQVQKIPESPINDNVVLQPHTWYSCPAGKKARVKGWIRCTNRGAAAIAFLTMAGVRLFTWSNAAAPNGPWDEFPDALTTANGGQMAFFETDLAAGETMVTDQDSGTNAQFEVNARVQETSA